MRGFHRDGKFVVGVVGLRCRAEGLVFRGFRGFHRDGRFVVGPEFGYSLLSSKPSCPKSISLNNSPKFSRNVVEI